MFSKTEIKKLASEAYSEFSKKHKVSCKISMIDLHEFWKLAKQSKLVQSELRERIPLKVGALVVHGEDEVIYLNEDILNQLSKDPLFIKSMVIHELCHIYLKKKIHEVNFDEEVKSEKRVYDMVINEFPKYSKFMV